MNATLRVVIADDHAILRAGTRGILEEAGNFEVVGEAGDAEQAVALCHDLRPDLLLIDIRMPGMTGIEAARRVSKDLPSTRVVILSAYDDRAYVRAAMDAGVTGYLLKTMPAEELRQAITAAATGHAVFDPAVSAKLAEGHCPDSLDLAHLSWREREVAELVAQGLANKAIATRLGISTRTVEGHLNHVFTKLKLSSRTELVRFVLDRGVVDPSAPEPHEASEDIARGMRSTRSPAI